MMSFSFFSELSKTSHLEGEDVQLSNDPSKSKSAIKKFLTEGKGDAVIQMCELKYSFPVVSTCQNFQTRESLSDKQLSYVTSLGGEVCLHAQ